MPGAPGRVVTLVPAPDAICDGVAYLIDAAVAETTFAALDHREKNGYERHEVALELAPRAGPPARGVVYIAARDNPAYLGPASTEEMVDQIRRCRGPSGANADYLRDLAAALRELGADDPHVFELEARLSPG